jgi:phosphatidate cytidylyltransferase
MLKQRVITALLLLAILLPALWAEDPRWFGALVALALTLAGWEWGRLNGQKTVAATLTGLEVLGAMALVHLGSVGLPAWVWNLVFATWLLGAAALIRGGPSGWLRLSAPLRNLVGLVALVPAGLALMAWKAQGLNALLSVLCLVWMADIAAYFGGRRFGRRKLAPAISPGKSWEGVWSGGLGVLLLAGLWTTTIDPLWAGQGLSLFGQLAAGLGWPLAVLCLLVLAALSVVGDLFESLVKRAVGAKDSSQLLPGHGGVLDRIDALLPTLPAALALTALAASWA